MEESLGEERVTLSKNELLDIKGHFLAIGLVLGAAIAGTLGVIAVLWVIS